MPDEGEAQGVIEMAFPEPILLLGAQEPEMDRFGVRLFQELSLVRSQRR